MSASNRFSREDIERDALQEFVGVFRRGGSRQHEAESVGKGAKLTDLDHPLLLALTIASALFTASGTLKYVSAAVAPPRRGLSAITSWYTLGVKRSGL